MTWFKVDDHLHSHRKAMRAGHEAMGLWVLAGSWSAAEESDGWVPSYVLPRLVGSDRAETLATVLVLAGLWSEGEQDGEHGYLFRAWDEYQPTREQLEAKRADARDRMRRARTQGGDVRANSARSARPVTPTPTRPDPTNNKNTAAKAAESEDFQQFWTLYPRKIGKAAAAKAWAKALRQTDVPTIAAALRAQVTEWQASPDFPKYVPHPTTWLNQGRWADEVTPALPGVAQDTTSGIQSTYDLPPLPEPPEHVRDAGGRAFTEWARETRAAQRAELDGGR